MNKITGVDERGSVQIAVRLPAPMLDMLREYAADIEANDLFGRRTTVADVVRASIADFLTEAGQVVKPKPPKRKKKVTVKR